MSENNIWRQVKDRMKERQKSDEQLMKKDETFKVQILNPVFFSFVLKM